MPKEKRKNDRSLRGFALPFTAVWIGSYLIACFVSYLVMDAARSNALRWFPNILLSRLPVLIIFIMMSLPALLQVQLIERLFKRSMRGWMVYSLAATTLPPLVMLVFNPGPYGPYSLKDAPLCFLVGTLAQTLWLWPHVSTFQLWPLKLWRHITMAWLWPVVGVVMGVVLSMLMSATAGNVMLMLLWAVLYSLLQGCVMHYLLSHPEGREKATVDLAAGEDLDHERLQQLQGQETYKPLWDMSDDQALQSEA